MILMGEVGFSEIQMWYNFMYKFLEGNGLKGGVKGWSKRVELKGGVKGWS